MCTLTVIPREDGYLLGMNRDERISRGPAAPPVRIELEGIGAISPRDIEGGTWIAANDRGVAFALLNWHENAQGAAVKTRSRGEVIPSLLRASSHGDVRIAFDRFDLKGILPFRLVAIFPIEMRIEEWRWNEQSVSSQVYPWAARHWFSSGLSDEQAALQRGQVCHEAWKAENAGSQAWLRELHASHVNGPGAFSVCVHRDVVRTLSYTEIACTRSQLRCGYFAGSPCEMQDLNSPVELQRPVD